MSGIGSVECSSSEGLSVVELFNEEVAASHEAVTVYQNPGENSGTVRMQEEEALAKATNPQLRSAEKKFLLEKKLEELTPMMEKQGYPMSTLIKTLAPHHPELAKKYAGWLKYGRKVKAYVEISKHLPAQEAQSLLKEVKDEYSYSFEYLCLVCGEELRRGLPQAETTLCTIKQRLGSSIYDLSHAAALLPTSDLGDLTELIKGAHKNAFADYLNASSCLFKQYSLHRLLLLEAREGESLLSEALETLELLRQNASKLWEELKESGRSYASIQYVEAWSSILVAEITNHSIRGELDQDLSKFLSTVATLKQEFPSNIWEYDYELVAIVKALSVIYPDKAEEVLFAIDDKGKILKGIFEFVKGQKENQEIDKEELLKTLTQKMSVTIQKCGFLGAADCIACTEGIERALPYLEKARLFIFDAKDKDNYEMYLEQLLQFEIDYHLPSAKETLNLLRATVEKNGSGFYDSIKLVVKAELSLIS